MPFHDLGHLAHLVGRADGDAHGEVAARRPRSIALVRRLHRPQDEGPQEEEAQEDDGDQHRGEAVAHLALGGAEDGVRLRHRDLDVEDAEDALGGGVHVAGRAGRLVVDRGDDAERPLAAAARAGSGCGPGAGARPSAALPRGRRRTRRTSCRRRGPPPRAGSRRPHPPFLVVDADPGHALLPADVLDDQVDPFGVVAQHHVVGRAAHRLGEAVCGEADQLVELRALDAQAHPVGRPEDGGGAEAEQGARCGRRGASRVGGASRRRWRC